MRPIFYNCETSFSLILVCQFERGSLLPNPQFATHLYYVCLAIFKSPSVEFLYNKKKEITNFGEKCIYLITKSKLRSIYMLKCDFAVCLHIVFLKFLSIPWLPVLVSHCALSCQEKFSLNV